MGGYLRLNSFLPAHRPVIPFATGLKLANPSLNVVVYSGVDNLPTGVRAYGLPATRLAEELGKRMVLNVVMVGFFAAVNERLKPGSLRQAVADSVPPAFKDLNLRAFDKGLEYGLSHMQAQPSDEVLVVPEAT